MNVEELREELSIYEKSGLSMSVEELRMVFRLYAILKSGMPVVAVSSYGNQHEYKKVKSINIHKFQGYADGRKIGVFGMLLDKSGRSTIEVPAERVRKIENGQG